MAITSTLIAGQRTKRFDVVWSLDADTAINLDHGFPNIPVDIVVTLFNAAAYIGQIAVTAVSATQVTLTKNAAGGSGGASVRVQIRPPLAE